MRNPLNKKCEMNKENKSIKRKWEGGKRKAAFESNSVTISFRVNYKSLNRAIKSADRAIKLMSNAIPQ